MPRASNTGIRGLYRAGDRYVIDLRWKDAATGEHRRHVEKLAPSVKLAEAKIRANKRLNAAMAGTFRKEAPRQLEAAFTEYIAWRRTEGRACVDKQEDSAARLVKSLGNVELGTVSPFAVERFKRDRAAGGAGPATINRDLAVLKHAYGLFVRWGWVGKPVADAIREMPKLKEPPGRVRYLTPDEETKLLAAFKGDGLRRMVIAALLTGMRQEELITLRREQVDLAAGEITLTKTKNNKVRRVPVVPALVSTLEDALRSSRTGVLFESRRRRGYTSTGVRSSFREAVDRAGLENFHFHDLRHSCATALRRRGVGIDVLQKLLGHSSLAMVQRYAHVDDHQLRDAMATLSVASPLPPATIVDISTARK